MPHHLPKKFLRIRDAVFILPDDFNGNISEAMTAFLQHLKDNQGKPVELIDPNGIYTSLGVILALRPDKKVSYDSSIYELVDGKFYMELPKDDEDQKEKSSEDNNEEKG